MFNSPSEHLPFLEESHGLLVRLYKQTPLFIMSVSFLNTHRPAMFNVCAPVLTLLCPLPFLQLDFAKNYLSLVQWTDCREPHRAYI